MLEVVVKILEVVGYVLEVLKTCAVYGSVYRKL